MSPLLKSVSMTSSYPPTQNLHPLSLLGQLNSRQVSGCLQVASPSVNWLLCLEAGHLTYATTREGAFDRLDAHLRGLSGEAPKIVSAVRVQVRLLFEPGRDAPARPLSPGTTALADYQAICWLVEQQHLPPDQAARLTEWLTQEVLEGFLQVRAGQCDLIAANLMGELPRYCRLNLRAVVAACYERQRQRHQASEGARSVSPQTPSIAPSPPVTSATPVAAPSVAPMAVSAVDSPTSEPPPKSSPQKSAYRIACIDDSPTVLRAINEFLDDAIFSVLMINDPVKALMQIIRNKPDLILLDVSMPNLDGYELCSLLRRHPNFKTTPIIMVTSNTGFIDRAKAKLVKASGYLTKPFGQSDLLKIIFKHLN